MNRPPWATCVRPEELAGVIGQFVDVSVAKVGADAGERGEWDALAAIKRLGLGALSKSMRGLENDRSVGVGSAHG